MRRDFAPFLYESDINKRCMVMVGIGISPGCIFVTDFGRSTGKRGVIPINLINFHALKLGTLGKVGKPRGDHQLLRLQQSSCCFRPVHRFPSLNRRPLPLNLLRPSSHHGRVCTCPDLWHDIRNHQQVPQPRSHTLRPHRPMLTLENRYTDLQPVGMGAFGLVWYSAP